jgi:thymidylate synthase
MTEQMLCDPSIQRLSRGETSIVNETSQTEEIYKTLDATELRVRELHPEYQYLHLIHKIIEKGTLETGRNGNTYSLFGHNMRFSLADGVVPFLTTKRVAWKTCLKELIWFIRGQTDNMILQNQNVHIWDGNGSREFLDSRGLTENREGDLGPVYGHQWRHFNAKYAGCDSVYDGKGIDQLAEIIKQLKDPAQRSSRRMLMTAWNPCQLNEMALPPCHVLCQFHVKAGKYLSCSLYQRSCDIGLGVPFNIASYSMLTHILAKFCGLEAHEFIYNMGDVHIYDDHVEPLMEQIKREPYEFPKMIIKNLHNDIDNYSVDDIELTTEYKCHPPIKMEMRA